MTDGATSQTENWSERTLAQIAQAGLAPTPENYAVYYAYFSGSNPNLTMAMDALLAEYGGAVTQAQCTEIYQAYLGLEAEQGVLKSTSNQIQEELNSVMNVIGRTMQGAHSYNKALDAFHGDISDDMSMERVRAAVERIAGETRVMAEQNHRLHTQLAKSTQQLTEVRYSLDQVRKDSLVDPLTEIGNRKYFANEMRRCAAEAAENGEHLSLLMADIDHFKNFNDAHGHLIGDQVLKLVARTLIENLKGRDIIARYGGEEFVILLPQTTVPDAEKVANQLRQSLSTKQVRRKNTNETLGIVTVSVGAAEYCPGEDFDSFIARADAALYDAKQTGRNRVVSRILGTSEIEAIQRAAATRKPAMVEDEPDFEVDPVA